MLQIIFKKVLTIPFLCSIVIIVLRNNNRFATVAQLVEYNLAKVGVAGSNPVCRSYKRISVLEILFSYPLTPFCRLTVYSGTTMICFCSSYPFTILSVRILPL